MRFDQSLADKLDATMSERPLPEDAVTSLTNWLADPARGNRYANGTGPHTITYAPSRWLTVTTWPDTFPDRRTTAGRATVSRADVVTAVRAASRTESWAEAFVASQVWGYGLTGYGPTRTHRVLARPRAEAVIAEAVSLLGENRPPNLALRQLNSSPLRRLPPLDARRQHPTGHRVEELAQGHTGPLGTGSLQPRLGPRVTTPVRFLSW